MCSAAWLLLKLARMTDADSDSDLSLGTNQVCTIGRAASITHT